MPLKLDDPSGTGGSFLNSEGVSPVAIQDPSKNEPFRIIAPILQAALFSIGFCVHYYRVHDVLLFGFTLSGWTVPPECIIFCIMIGVLAIQQIGWEAQLMKDTVKIREYQGQRDGAN